MRAAALACLVLLSACSQKPPSADATELSTAPDLESAAIERGLVRDPASRDIVGLYARDTDRLCIVPDGSGYRGAAYVDYGEGIACSGRGRVTRDDDRLRLSLGEGCTIEAAFDGETITFPAQVPEGCRALCTSRASFAALSVGRLSASVAEAAAMLDGRGRLGCRTG